MEKVSQLEIACSENDVNIKFLEEELSKLKIVVSERDAQIASLGELQASAKHDVLQYQTISKRGIADMQWVIKDDCGNPIRLHQSCVEMTEKYSEALTGKKVIYSFPEAQRRILDRFSDMVAYKYLLFELLEGDKVDVDVLKEKFSSLDALSKCDDASSSA
ncbi:unnamed protein product [Lactuca virosa]|uniref:Uncharacterized protein n=1 Tax=Lactuca virosa TaxID=75947 RepID=A0AAU9P1N2_9ASTR|nr:unnamed protein product [Lactuca virosa]